MASCRSDAVTDKHEWHLRDDLNASEDGKEPSLKKYGYCSSYDVAEAFHIGLTAVFGEATRNVRCNWQR